MIRRIGIFLWELTYWPVSTMPGSVGRKLRGWLFRLVLKECGTSVVFDVGVSIQNPQFVSIGDNCWIDRQAIIIAGPISKRGRKIAYCKLGAGEGEDEVGVQEGYVHISRNCHIGPQTVLQGHGGVFVGANVTLAAGSKVYSAVHDHKNRDDPSDATQYQFSTMAPAAEQCLLVGHIHIGAGAAVGLNSIVLPGVRLGDGAWLGAASLASRGIPANTIAVGTPAEVAKTRTALTEQP